MKNCGLTPSVLINLKLDERTSQVRLIKAIYSSAKMSFVYLGEPSQPGNFAALALGEKIVQMTEKFESRRPRPPILKTSVFPESKVQSG